MSETAVSQPEAPPSGWRGHLRLHYTSSLGRTIVRDRHEGPLRVLQPLYPEGDAICHQVLVHPPGGIVGGDVLQVDAQLEAGTHALVTTPGATRFYRSEGTPALQQVQVQLAEGARLEWLPLETIAYSGCQARNRFAARLAPGAQMMGWDVLVLGLPAAGQAFERGFFHQRVEVGPSGAAAWPWWIEGGRIAADDALLRHGALGLAGHAVVGCLWFAAAPGWPAAQRDALLQAARDEAAGAAMPCGITAPQSAVVVLRVLGAGVEPVMQLLQRVRAAWRAQAWNLAAQPPRIWRT